MFVQDEVMHNVSAYNMNPHKAANEGNDAQNVLEQINLTSSNLRQVTVSYNHPDSATDNLLPQTEINYTQVAYVISVYNNDNNSQ